VEVDVLEVRLTLTEVQEPDPGSYPSAAMEAQESEPMARATIERNGSSPRGVYSVARRAVKVPRGELPERVSSPSTSLRPLKIPSCLVLGRPSSVGGVIVRGFRPANGEVR